MALEGLGAINFEVVTDFILKALIWLVLAILVGVGAWFGWYRFKEWKKFRQFNVVVWEQDAFGHWHELKDVAGIFLDKLSNNKLLFLKKANVGLNCNNIPYVKSGEGLGKKIYLIRTGLKNFRFVKLEFDKSIFNLKVTEEDENWSINTYERSKKLLAKKTLLEYMPYIITIVAFVIIMIVFIYFFKKLDVLQGTAEAFRDAATELAKYHGNWNGTAVLQ